MRRPPVSRVFGAGVRVHVQCVEGPAQLGKVRPHDHVEEVVPHARPRRYGVQLGHVLLVAPRSPQGFVALRDETRQLDVYSSGDLPRQLTVLLRDGPGLVLCQGS